TSRSRRWASTACSSRSTILTSTARPAPTGWPRCSSTPSTKARSSAATPKGCWGFRTRRAMARSTPLGQFDRNVFRAAEENQLAVMEFHHAIAQLDPARGELGDFGIEVIDRKAHVIEAELVETVDIRIL